MELENAYNLLREFCGLSQQDAADFHDTRLDSVKSWCSDRRLAPQGAVNELQQLARQIATAGEAYARELAALGDDGTIMIALPRDDAEARSFGFPSLGAYMRGVAIAVAHLPPNLHVRMHRRGRGDPPADKDTPKLTTPTKARFDGALTYLDDGHVQGSFAVFAGTKGGAAIESNIRLCADEAEALGWLDRQALARRIDAYALFRKDEHGRPIQKPLGTRL
ncbi:hypothetical protein [Bradyrhizobium sp. HKCCYLR1023]|uniref:hypothetical protein n=1 Tax=Bradyrhizobium TaxID=374 RepID=UPI003EBB493B